MFDFEGHPLDSLNVWKYVKTGASAVAVSYSLDNGTTWAGCDAIKDVSHDVEIIFDKGTVLQNNHLKDTIFDGVAVKMQNGSLIMKEGAVIRDNTVSAASGSSGVGGRGGAVHLDESASFTMEGGEIYGNYASFGGGIYNEANMSVSGAPKIYNASDIMGAGVGQGATEPKRK